MADNKDKQEIIQEEENIEVQSEENAPMTLEEENSFLTERLTQYIEQFKLLAEAYQAEKKRADEMAVSATRLQAEFDQFRKRNAESAKRARLDGALDVLTAILPKLDVFERAMTMFTDKAVAEGMEMLYRQLLDILTEFKVGEIPAQGMMFDPELHDAVGQAPAPQEQDKGRIAAVVKKGYQTEDGRIIRHTGVVVYV